MSYLTILSRNFKLRIKKWTTVLFIFISKSYAKIFEVFLFFCTIKFYFTFNDAGKSWLIWFFLVDFNKIHLWSKLKASLNYHLKLQKHFCSNLIISMFCLTNLFEAVFINFKVYILCKFLIIFLKLLYFLRFYTIK